MPTKGRRHRVLTRFYTPHEVASILGVEPISVYRLLAAKTLRGHRVGRAWRVSPYALKTFLDRVSSFDDPNDRPLTPVEGTTQQEAAP